MRVLLQGWRLLLQERFMGGWGFEEFGVEFEDVEVLVDVFD